ncbi:MAG: iron-containing alcohol dehydrogenase [Pseudomonadota bacterium]
MTAQLYLPNISRVGGGCRQQLPVVLMELGVSKPLLVSDPFIQQMGLLDEIDDLLKSAGIVSGRFSDCVPDPTTDSVAACVSAWQQQSYDCVIGVGGGSSMDTAKAAAVLACHGGQMRDYKVPNAVPKGFPIIAVPTTAGTGSEATRATVVTDAETQEKMLCMGVGFLPSAAVVDYELTLKKPYRLTADTGIDTLCHALEAYVSKKANRFTDPTALAAMENVIRYLPTACEQPDNLEAREAMMLAAYQGGIAFSNASVTLIHGMSRPIGAFYHVPHGLSNAMLLPEVTKFSIPGAPQRYAHCARVMGMATDADNIDDANRKLVDGLFQLCESLQVPSPRAYGIDQQEYAGSIETMSAQALASGSPANNPRVPTQQEIAELYRSVW